jgi:uroporphyrinogen III methyltransferase/synthase
MSEQNVHTRPLQGKRVLVTRTREQASLLSERLQELGASPVEFPTIRIVVLYLLQTRQIDIITFTSSSTVRNFVQWLTSCTEREPEPHKRGHYNCAK